MVALGKLRTISSLDLSRTQVGDAGLALLGPQPELGFMRLAGSKVTDKSVEVIRRFAKLQSLALAGTQISDRGVQQCIETFPNLTVGKVAAGPQLEFQVHKTYRGGKLLCNELMIGDTIYGLNYPKHSANFL